MPPKRSIKDFFSAAPRPPQLPSTGSLPDAGHSSSLRLTNQVSQSTIADTKNNQRETWSFGTHSTSSLPTSSAATVAVTDEGQLPIQSPICVNSSISKRIVSDGQQVVLNSDSDDDSLPDLDWGELHPRTVKPMKSVFTQVERSAENAADDLRRPSKKGKTEKKSVTVAVETAQRNAEMEKHIQEQKADLGRSFDAPMSMEDVISEERIGQVVQDDNDPDKAHRLYLAMQRTSAAQTESVYYFFKSASDSITLQPRFPLESLPKTQWTSNFKDTVSRDQTFLTGFAHQAFRLQRLPEELASWMIFQFCYDRNEVLLSKYLEILESHHEQLQRLLDKNKIETLFKALSADIKSLGLNTELSRVARSQSTDEPVLSTPLRSVARLLRSAAPWLRTKARSHALHILFFVCLDERVLADANTLNAIQEAIEAITRNFTDNKRLVLGLSNIIPQLLGQIRDPALQHNIICALPARSPLTAYLQRYLALSFLVYPEVVDVPLADPSIPQMIHTYLSTAPHFRISKRTNYRHVAILMTLLDIAVGPGPLSVSHHPPMMPMEPHPISSPTLAPIPDSSTAKDFNKQVDALVQHIKILGNSIVEAGAVADLGILEAKDSTERLCARLEHAVRLGGKKFHQPFADDHEGESDHAQPRLSRFFLQAHKPPPLPPPPARQQRGIFDTREDAHDDAGSSNL